MKDTLNDSAERGKRTALARRVEQTHTMDEMRASYKRSTRLVDV